MIGTVAALKTTGERVFIIGQNDNGFECRRPVISQSGITHVVETFTPQELETTNQSTERELVELLYKRKMENKLYAEYQKELEAEKAQEATEAEDTKVIRFTN